MPKFEKKETTRNSSDEGAAMAVVPPMIVEPKCHVCKSKYRTAIDKMLAAGIGFTEVSRTFDFEIDRRSIANHAEKHMNYEESAIRQIVEHEAQQMSESAEEGIKGVLARKVFLQTALYKVHQAVVNGEVEVEVRDAIGIIQQLDKMDSATSSAAVDEIRIQFNAFLQAMKELVDPKEWDQILARTREILEASDIGIKTELPQLESPKEKRQSSEG